MFESDDRAILGFADDNAAVFLAVVVRPVLELLLGTADPVTLTSSR